MSGPGGTVSAVRVTLVLVLMLTTGGIPVTDAHAQTEAGDEADAITLRVEELSLQGIQAYGAKRYEEALSRFKAALALQPVANLLFNIARTYEASGQLEEARVYYERLLRAADAEDEARAKARVRLEQVNADIAARTPAPAQTPANASPSTAVTVSASPSGEEDGGLVETWGWVSVGLGTAFAILGGTFAVLAQDEADAFSASDELPVKNAYRSNAEGYGLAADLGLGIGGAALVTGVVLLVLDATPTTLAGGGTSVSPWVAEGLGGVQATVSF